MLNFKVLRMTDTCTTWLLLFATIPIVFCQSGAQKDIIVNEGNRLVLECKSREIHKRFVWKFTDLKENTNIIYTSLEAAKEGYIFNCSIEKQHCHSEIVSVSQQDAGSYICLASEEGKELVPLEQYSVNVGRFECSSNIPRNNEAVAMSDCDKVEASPLVLTCQLIYKGLSPNIPISWRKKWRNGTIVDVMNGTMPQSTVSQMNRTISVEVREKVVVDMKDQMFECIVQDQSMHHNIMPCKEALNSLSYVRHRHEKSPPMSQDDRKGVTCKADTSSGIHCMYEWIVPYSETKVEVEYLEPKDMKGPGTYRCEAICDFGNRVSCRVAAHEFELTASKSSSALIQIVAGVVSVFLIAIFVIILVVCIKRRRGRSKKGKSEKGDVEKNELAKVQAGNEPLLSETPRKPPADTPVPSQVQPSNQPPPLSDQSSNGQPTSSRRKQQFKRGTSGKGSQDFHSIAEEGDKNQVSQVGQKIQLNNAKGPAMGIGHMNGRIYCVAKDTNRLFIFIDTPPYNRMMPEEMAISDLEKPQAMAVCQESGSLYVSEYSDKNGVYRIFPLEKEGNKVSKGILDGSPGDLAVVASKPNTIVVILKRDRKMHIEIYDSSCCRRGSSVSESETWEKKYIISPNSIKITLPLFVCTSNIRTEESSTSHRLFLLYGSDKFLTGGEFESYKVSQINLETSLVYNTFDLKDLTSDAPGERFVPIGLESDRSGGGLLVLEKKGQLMHLNAGFNNFVEEAKLGASLSRFCFRPENRMVILGSSNKTQLTCYKLKDAPANC